MDTAERTRLRALCKTADLATCESFRDDNTGLWTVREREAPQSEIVAEVLWTDVEPLRDGGATEARARLFASVGATLPTLLDALDAAERERDQALPEVRRLREREEHFAQALRVADGGQYRNDWDSAIRRVVAELDAARAIIDGRTTPPTEEEQAAHAATDGDEWLVRYRVAYEGEFIFQESFTDLSGFYDGGMIAERWWPLDADGRPCAWPTVTL
jgi:hypothetical protein